MDYNSSFDFLLEKDESFNIHVKYLQTFMNEMFRTMENLKPPFMREIFCERPIIYNLRNNNELLQPRVRVTRYGSQTMKHRGQRLYLSLPQHIKNAQ